METVEDKNKVDEIMRTAKKQWVGGLFAFLVLVSAVGIVGYSYFRSTKETAVTASEKSLTVEAPQPTPTAVIAVKPVVAVWNGSGISGAAGSLAESLKKEGYEVLETKNAPKTQTGSTVFLSDKFVSQKESIETMVKKVGIKNPEVVVEKTDSYEMRIVIGK